jgi:hypothetical protein
MCKYCEIKVKTGTAWEVHIDSSKHPVYSAWDACGGLVMVWDDIHGYQLEDIGDGIFQSGVRYCPWCGRKLAKPSIEGLPTAEEYDKMKCKWED